MKKPMVALLAALLMLVFTALPVAAKSSAPDHVAGTKGEQNFGHCRSYWATEGYDYSTPFFNPGYNKNQFGTPSFCMQLL